MQPRVCRVVRPVRDDRTQAAKLSLAPEWFYRNRLGRKRLNSNLNIQFYGVARTTYFAFSRRVQVPLESIATYNTLVVSSDFIARPSGQLFA